MALKVGIIGPTNMKKLSKLTGKSEEFFLKKAELIGSILAQEGCEVWVNSDAGMVSAVALAYKKAGGQKLVMLYPEKGEPWSNTHAAPHLQNADEVSSQPNWFWANYQVVTAPDVCICVGLSAGTLSELAYIKWNRQFSCGNLKRLIALEELVRDKRIPAEIEVEIGDILLYLENIEELGPALVVPDKTSA
ncbi:MAG: hypothetical protein Q8P12_08090 [bacterium]|nr:hypothetical protein [bacterium]